MGYLNKFATQAAYDAGKYDVDAPAISYIESTGDFIFDKTKPGRPKPTTNGVYIRYTDGSYSAYNVLDSGKTPVGVAIKTSACALLLHPSEGENKQWSQNTSTEIPGVVTDDDSASALSDYAGKANTEAVMNSGLAGSAFTWATEVVYADGSQGWLPSCGEMEQMRLNATNINTAMSLIGGTAIDFSSKTYWSSTQYSAYGSWNWGYSSPDWDGGDKNTGLCCRSVTDF